MLRQKLLHRLVHGRSVVVAWGFLVPFVGAAGEEPHTNPVPSIELTGFTAFTGQNLCSSGGSADLTELDSGFTSSQSDCTNLVVSGHNVVGNFCEDGPFSAGTHTDFEVVADGAAYSVPAGTPITVVVSSNNGLPGQGPVSFVSRMALACDTGQVLGIASFVPATNGCDESDPQLLCLNNGRFAVSATFQNGGTTGQAQAVQLTSDTGYFWFFNAANVEALVKVINGCGVDSKYWVFAGGLTNVQTQITVHDTLTGATKTYQNPANT